MSSPAPVDPEALYRLLHDTMLQGVVHQDRDGRIISVNPAAERILGRTIGEMRGQTSIDRENDCIREDGSIFPGVEHPSMVALRTGRPARDVVMGVHNPRLRRRVWITIDAVPILRPGESEPCQVYTLFDDITERRQARLDVRAGEDRYRRIIEETHEGVWMLDLEGVTTFVNRQMAAMLGRTPEEMVGRSAFDFVWPEDIPAGGAEWESRKRDDAPAQSEFRYLHRDGRPIWCMVNSNPMPGPDGEPVGFLGMFIDITDRKRSEEELSRVNAVLPTVNDSTAALVVVKDTDQRIVMCNPAAARLFDKTPEQMVGLSDRDYLDPDTAAPIVAHDRQVIESGAAGAFEESFGPSVFHCVKTPLRDSRGEVSGLIVIATDITARARSERQLADAKASADEALRQAREAKATAEAAGAAKDHFLAVLSHELRTPLTPALATAHALESDPVLDDERRDMATMIRRNIELEARLIDDLLDLTRISRGKLELDLQAVDLHVKIKHVLAMCAADIAARRLVVQTRLAADRHGVRGDPARLQQIIWNLLKNAIKFGREGGTITVSTAGRAEGEIAFVVTDDGVGIAPASLGAIFDAFEQGGRDITRRFGGLGLGLSITRALVRMHGGTILAASEGPGRGATFTVELPLAADDEAARSASADTRDAAMDCAVLLVEDHDDTRRVLAHLLGRQGCRVSTAGAVAEALEIARGRRFDVVISDIGLPDASGLELMRQLKDLYGLRGIALSGYGMEEDLAQSAAAGFEAHLVKPINIAALVKTMRRLLGDGAPTPAASATIAPCTTPQP